MAGNWNLIYSQLLLPSAEGQFAPQILAGITKSRLACKCDSPQTPITWRRACRMSMLLPGPEGGDSLIVARRRIPLALMIEVQLPDAPSFSLRLEVPPWHPDMLIQLWTGDIDAPIADLTSNRQMFVVTGPEQAYFQLAASPSQPHLSQLYINGIKATYSTEYLIDGQGLTWIGPPSLEPGDEVEILY